MHVVREFCLRGDPSVKVLGVSGVYCMRCILVHIVVQVHVVAAAVVVVVVVVVLWFIVGGGCNGIFAGVEVCEHAFVCDCCVGVG